LRPAAGQDVLALSPSRSCRANEHRQRAGFGRAVERSLNLGVKWSDGARSIRGTGVRLRATMISQPNGDSGEAAFRRLWNYGPRMPIIPFGIPLRVALRHDSLSHRHRTSVPISHATTMSRSTDQTIDRNRLRAPGLESRMGDDDRKRRGDSGLPGAPGSAVITKTRPQVKRPNMYRVLLLNDDYTPMEFVVDVLQRFFNKDRDTATRIMLHVHHHGIGECGVFTYEVAETKVTQVMDFARKHQHPLQCVMEKK
jgi:ATP-dependent Clp protease adaptor protein ClpS